MSNRQQVEAYWKKVYVDVDVDKTALVMAEAQKPICLCNEEGEPSEALAWAAALAFTEEHKRKAAELQEAILWLKVPIMVRLNLAAPDEHPAKFILAMLETALAQHMIGVK